MASSIYIYEDYREYQKVYGNYSDSVIHQTDLIDMFIKGEKLWVVTNTNHLKERPRLTKSVVHFRNGSADEYMEGDELCVTYDKIRYNSKNNMLEIFPRFLRKPLFSVKVDRFYGQKVKGKKPIDYTYRFYDMTRDRINLVIEC